MVDRLKIYERGMFELSGFKEDEYLDVWLFLKGRVLSFQCETRSGTQEYLWKGSCSSA